MSEDCKNCYSKKMVEMLKGELEMLHLEMCKLRTQLVVLQGNQPQCPPNPAPGMVRK